MRQDLSNRAIPVNRAHMKTPWIHHCYSPSIHRAGITQLQLISFHTRLTDLKMSVKETTITPSLYNVNHINTDVKITLF